MGQDQGILGIRNIYKKDYKPPSLPSQGFSLHKVSTQMSIWPGHNIFLSLSFPSSFHPSLLDISKHILMMSFSLPEAPLFFFQLGKFYSFFSNKFKYYLLSGTFIHTPRKN